jgi:hypothetical protein
MADTTLHPQKPPLTPVPVLVPKLQLGNEAGKSAATAQPQPTDGDASPPHAGRPLLRSFTGSAAAGFCVSLLCHLVLFILLAVWIFDVRIPLVPMLIDGANKTGVPLELEDAPEISLTNRGGEIRNVPTVPAARLLATPSDIGKLPTDLTDSVDLPPSQTAGSGNAAGEGNDDAGTGAIPHGDVKVSKNVVRKGSFRVWAIPEKPQPRKPYYIYIEVIVPKDLGKPYRATDLDGTIRGNESRYDKSSADYLQQIPSDRRLARLGGPEYRKHTFRRDTRGKRWVWVDPKNRFGYLPVVDGKALLMIKVPGAETERIKDTIKIRSKLLKEQQTLEIVF